MNTYRRLLNYVTRYWPLIALSLALSDSFIALNALSLWMVASLINTVMVGPESIPMAPVAAAPTDSANDSLGVWTANLIQRSTPLRTLARLCFILLGVFMAKNIFLYMKDMVGA